jgi:Ca-activated chloride channel family protein
MRSLLRSLCVLLVFGALLRAQFKTDVALVTVIATVVDGKGRNIANLGMDEFIVEEDGQPQTIKHILPTAELPISIGVVLDASGSMQTKIRTAQRAIDGFFSAIHKDDEIFLMTFAARASVIADFTSDRGTLTKALMNGVSLGGGTSLYDSLYQALQKVKQGRYQKKAVLIVTDGEDTTSLTRFDKALDNIREADMLVYSIGIKGTPAFDMSADRLSTPDYTTVDMKVLNRFGEASGGKAWEISEASFGKNLDGVLETIATELRSQYSIGYYPNHPVKDGKWHSVRIRMKNPDYSARARKEYLAQAADVYAGRPLGDVLRDLQKRGLNIVFSSELVKPEMKVATEPKEKTPRKILDEVLAAHGLAVRPGPRDSLVVVRASR